MSQFSLLTRRVLGSPMPFAGRLGRAMSTSGEDAVRSLTNPICLATTAAQYPFSGTTQDIVPMRHGVHMQKKCFANALNKSTFEAGRALDMAPKEIAKLIVENLKTVMGPNLVNDASKGIDMAKMLVKFEDGLEDILRLQQSEEYSRNELFEELSDKLMRTLLFNKIKRSEVGAPEPPADAAAAAAPAPHAPGAFGAFVPTARVANTVKPLLAQGLQALGLSEAEARRRDLSTLYAFSDLYDAYNAAVDAQAPFAMPPAFFRAVELCEDETRLLSNIDKRIMKHDWRQAEARNKGGISISAQRKQWLGESAIRNAKLIGALTLEGLSFLRFDVGGVSLPEHPEVVAARQAVAAGHNKYSPLCEADTLDALAKFYTDTGAGRQFSPDEVMVLGMREKGALPWMLDFVGNGPMFIPRPTYNPNPSAGLYHGRQVLSFDVTGPHRYAPMIEALKLHRGGGIVVLPIIGNPYSTTLTAEEEAGFIEVLRHNPTLAFVADHAYRGYNMHGDLSAPGGKLQPFDGKPTRDVLEHAGFYDESPLDPKTGKLLNLRVTLHSSSKLFNDASGPGTCAAHRDTIAFLGDMLRGSYTQAHARDRKVIPAIVKHLDFDAPRRWMENMKSFTAMTEGKLPGFRDLGYDCPPFICYDAGEYLAKHDLNPELAQQYFMSRSPGLCGIFGGFGPGSAEIFRLGFTGETDPARIKLTAEKFVEYANDDEAIVKFKAKEDDLTKNYYRLLDIVKAKGE